jgi:hypothetical protein
MRVFVFLCNCPQACVSSFHICRFHILEVLIEVPKYCLFLCYVVAGVVIIDCVKACVKVVINPTRSGINQLGRINLPKASFLVYGYSTRPILISDHLKTLAARTRKWRSESGSDDGRDLRGTQIQCHDLSSRRDQIAGCTPLCIVLGVENRGQIHHPSLWAMRLLRPAILKWHVPQDKVRRVKGRR